MQENSIEAMKHEQMAGPEAVGGTGRTAVSAVSDLLRFPFQDPEWRNKLGIGALLMFLNFIIPLVPMLAVGGYMMKLMRQAVNGEEPVLPEWDDWGDLIMEGLKGGAIALIYLLPGYILLFGGYFVVAFVPLLALPFSVAAGSGSDPAAGLAASVGLSVVSAVVMIIVIGIGLFLIFGGLMIVPLALGNYLREGDFNAALRVRQLWKLLKVNKSGFVAAWLLYFGLIYLMYFPMMLLYFTLILICLLPFLLPPFLFYIYSIGAVTFGQYYRETWRIWQKKTAV